MARGRSISLALFLLLAGWTRLAGQGAGAPAPKAGLQVAPTRVVFDNRRRTTTVSITNTGGAQGHYRLSLMRLEMDDNGGCTEQPLERGSAHAELQDMLLFAPREVTLNPLESQTVRIQVRKPAELPPGEYRLHLLFQEEPPSDPEPAAEPGPAPPGATVSLTAQVGLSIPVIFRNGDTSAKAAVTGTALDAERKRLSFRLERTGNQSVYGDLQAIYQPRSGKPRVLAQIRGVAVYTPNAFRNVNLALDPAPQGAGRIQVTYCAPREDGGALLAEGSLELR